MPWRSGPTWWSLQNRGSPRPRSRAKRGGRAPEAPKGGRRVPRRGDTTRPLDAEPAGEIRHFPRKLSRGTRPARPAGGGTNAFCFLSLVAPAPPGSQNCPFPGSARVPRNHFPRCNPRALLEIKDNRFPLHKHSVSTSPLSLLSAFPQNLTVPRGERTLPPRPSPQSGRAGYSRRGSAPQGEPFRHLSLRWER